MIFRPIVSDQNGRYERPYRERSRSPTRNDRRPNYKKQYSTPVISNGKKVPFARTRFDKYIPSNNANKPSARRDAKEKSERDILLCNYRKDYCATREEITTKLEELAKQDDLLEKEKDIWTRTTPADLHYKRDDDNPKIIKGTPKLLQLCEQFKTKLINRRTNANKNKPEYIPPPRKNRAKLCTHKSKK